MTFHTGEQFPAWKGNLFSGGLGSTSLVRLVVDPPGKVPAKSGCSASSRSASATSSRGPDGSIYLLTDNAKGRLLSS
jgi:glucose/arabinose dehydrogenase